MCPTWQQLMYAVRILSIEIQYQVNEIICIEELQKDLCIKFGYFTKNGLLSGKGSGVHRLHHMQIC